MKYTSHKIDFVTPIDKPRGRSPGLSQERMQEPISLYILDSPWIRPWPLTVFIHEFINC
jgi:hypothetical protein